MRACGGWGPGGGGGGERGRPPPSPPCAIGRKATPPSRAARLTALFFFCLGERARGLAVAFNPGVPHSFLGSAMGVGRAWRGRAPGPGARVSV